MQVPCQGNILVQRISFAALSGTGISCILDGGVHYAAATRLFLQGESAAQSVSALTTLTRDYLPPIDTISATLQLKSGAAGTVQFSFGSHIEAFEWDIGLEGGWVKISDETVTVKPVGEEAIVKDFEPTSGVAEEIAVWAKGMTLQQPSQQQSVQEALADLEFLDKIFKSGEQQGVIVKYELQ